MNPVMTLRWMIDGKEQPEPVEVLWTGTHDDGSACISLLSGVPFAAYTLTLHDEPFTPGQAIGYDLTGWLGRPQVFNLSRPDAGRFAVALIEALIDGSESLIGYFTEREMTR